MGSIVVERDAPIFIIINMGSGSEEASISLATIEDVLTQAERWHEIEQVRDAALLGGIATRVVARARAAGGIVVVAGGDGTINAIIRQLMGSGCVMGVIPLGTFNYFCRTHHIPLDVREATEALLGARAFPIQVGTVNNRPFLVNASLGLYPQALQDREGFKQRFGRHRFVALCSGLVTLFHDFRQLLVRIEQDGDAATVRTPTLFVGNNRLQLKQIGMSPDVIRDGQLTTIMLKPVGTLAILWLMVRGAMKQLGEAEDVTSFAFHEMSVSLPGRLGSRRVKLATDGEIVWMDTPLVFRVATESVYLIKPEASTGSRR